MCTESESIHPEVRAFKCGCGTLVEICDSSREYFTFYGNFLVGEFGGLIGGSRQPEKFSDIKPFRICRHCLLEMIGKTMVSGG